MLKISRGTEVPGIRNDETSVGVKPAKLLTTSGKRLFSTIHAFLRCACVDAEAACASSFSGETLDGATERSLNRVSLLSPTTDGSYRPLGYPCNNAWTGFARKVCFHRITRLDMIYMLILPIL